MRRLLSGLLAICLAAGLTGCSMEANRAMKMIFLQSP